MTSRRIFVSTKTVIGDQTCDLVLRLALFSLGHPTLMVPCPMLHASEAATSPGLVPATRDATTFPAFQRRSCAEQRPAPPPVRKVHCLPECLHSSWPSFTVSSS